MSKQQKSPIKNSRLDTFVSFLISLTYIILEFANDSWDTAVVNIANNSPNVVSTCLIVITLIEGGDIVLARLREVNEKIKKDREERRLKKEKEIIDDRNGIISILKEKGVDYEIIKEIEAKPIDTKMKK